MRLFRPISALVAIALTLVGCAESHPRLDEDGGAPATLQDAAPCAVRPVYAGIRCVGIACDYCPTVEAAFLARASELGCCLPFRCDWRPEVPTAVVLANVAASASCDALASAGR